MHLHPYISNPNEIRPVDRVCRMYLKKKQQKNNNTKNKQKQQQQQQQQQQQNNIVVPTYLIHHKLCHVDWYKGLLL